MCTTAAINLSKLEDDLSWFLLKTRDPVSWMRWDDEIKLFNSPKDKFNKLIIQNPNENEDGYYGGINEKGVAIVATFVRVTDDQISYIRKPYVRLILDAASAKEAVEIIKSFNPKIGGNIFVADKKECYGIEAIPRAYHIEEVVDRMVKTNHFYHFTEKDIDVKKDPKFLDWTRAHFDRASELVENVGSLDDMKAILRDRKNSDKGQAICTTKNEEDCFTHSAFIFDCKNVKVHYAQGCPSEVEFKEYGF